MNDAKFQREIEVARQKEVKVLILKAYFCIYLALNLKSNVSCTPLVFKILENGQNFKPDLKFLKIEGDTDIEICIFIFKIDF